MPRFAHLLVLSAALSLSACGKHESTETTEPAPDAAKPEPAASIDADALKQHIATLASDDFGGRLPGTDGEDKTVAFLTEQFKAVGLQPGNPDGSYLQEVPLVGIDGTPTLTLTVDGKDVPMQPRTDYVATTARFAPQVQIKDSPLVFVGYGIQAPEYGWDDYKGLDVKGKTLVMLINDPALPDPNDSSKLDPTMFKGAGMTYYGRWTYKYEIAGKLGADGVIIIHDTGPAGYPWAVVENSWTGEAFELANPDGNKDRVPVQSWFTMDKAKLLFEGSNLDLAELEQKALSKDFEPVPLNAKVSVTIDNKVREVTSHNVVGLIPGSDPQLKDEVVIYSSHWDHLGTDTTIDGDQIYNGAVDNATGTAALIELGRAFHDGAVKPKRSVLMLAVTAEEQGLLGSRYYAENPLYPLSKTLADLNIDAMPPYGAGSELEVVGFGQSTLEDTLKDIASAQGLSIKAESEPEKGFYYRSDQFSFAKVGVPGLYAESGGEIIGKPAGYGKEKRDAYTANNYHQPSDEMADDWDFAGMAKDLTMYYDVGLSIANGDSWPEWKDGSEFKAIREKSLADGN